MEKLLIFHLDDTEYKKLEQIARNLKIRCERIADSSYNQTLESLVSGKINPLAADFTGKVPTESLLLMCGLSDKRMDKLLFELRRAGVSIDFKAVQTPTNQNWTVLKMLFEMQKERDAYESQKRLSH